MEDVSGMVLPTKSKAHRITAAVCVLILIFLLTACGGSSNSNISSTATSMTQVSTPTATKSVTFKTYTGADFTINYPQDWSVTPSDSGVNFIDPLGDYNIAIGTTLNPNGAATSAQLADSGLTGAKTNLKNVQTISVALTTTLANQSWSQRSLSGVNTYQGQSTDLETVVLATNHPTHAANTKGYVIVYVASKQKFDQARSMYFMPMLQSFKFTS